MKIVLSLSSTLVFTFASASAQCVNGVCPQRPGVQLGVTGPFGGQVQFGVALPQFRAPATTHFYAQPAAQPVVAVATAPVKGKQGRTPPTADHRWGEAPGVGEGWFHKDVKMAGLKFLED